MIKDIISLRDQKAKLLGYENYAAFVLEERMAKSPQKVESFLHELLEKATPYSQKEIEELKALAKADGIEDMQSYDHAYYAEKLRKQKYDLNDEELKPYFPLEKFRMLFSVLLINYSDLLLRKEKTFLNIMMR